MSALRAQPGPRETPHDIAADWWLREIAGRLSTVDMARRDRWLEEDPAHRSAWESVRLAMTTVSDNAADPELIAMRSAALAARGEPRRGLRALLGIGLALVVAGGGAVLVSLRATHQPPDMTVAGGGPFAAISTMLSDPGAASYQTAVGERATITLPDGSIATLDTNSALKVAYTGRERRVNLLRGQALFEVAKHKPIPFLVVAGDRRITAVGTKFDVRIEGSGARARVRVALLEGVVRVATLSQADNETPSAVVTMAAGELLDAAPAAPVQVAAADVDRVASWLNGALSFDDQPLGQAVAEMNRYTDRPISLSDPRLANLRVSGVFKTGDPEHFAETMAEIFPIRVDHDAEGRPVLGPKG